ncbi:HNH endonuclease [Clostridium sp.]|uniref:HNH endonuclease n=1 Tax=Clostridium sp. TaxID=1506 RepID=UPI001A4125AC|nr:HNH endonuclease [Clostridium sp.]MBK5242412.1 HNH endonuclease [Clostridium sp.]
MLKCEICGNPADKHHIVYKSKGGIEFPLNFRYLCSKHHRGKFGPHKNRRLDLEYKLNMQKKLGDILINEFYNIEELVQLLNINRGIIIRILKQYKLNDKGFRKVDIIFKLMGSKKYDEKMLLEVESEKIKI